MYAGKEVEIIERAIFLKGIQSERVDDLPLIGVEPRYGYRWRIQNHLIKRSLNADWPFFQPGD